MRTLQFIHLDYRRAEAPWSWPGLVLLGLSVLVLAAMALYYLDLDRRLAQASARVAQLAGAQPQRPVRTAPAGDDKARQLEVQAANKVLRELALPWESMFRAVEASGGAGVALLALEPDPVKGLVRINGEAKDFAAMLAYVKQLGMRAEFRKVLLQSHRVNTEDRERPIRFFVTAVWKVDTP